MPQAAERDHAVSAPAYLASRAAALSTSTVDEAREDVAYREIADRRARLENAETLRRARAL